MKSYIRSKHETFYPIHTLDLSISYFIIFRTITYDAYPRSYTFTKKTLLKFWEAHTNPDTFQQ